MNVKTIEMCAMSTCQQLLLLVIVLTLHAYLLFAILTHIFRKHLCLGAFYMTFAMIFSFSIVDKDYLPAETYTYVSSAWVTTSWLDHMHR